MRIIMPFVLLLLTVLAAPMHAGSAQAAATFNVPQAELPDPLVLVAYGDMRFTGNSETRATNPGARRALIAKITAESPVAIFINGDIPWHGIASDYAVF